MNPAYNINGDVHGGGLGDEFSKFADATVGTWKQCSLALIIALVLLVLWLVLWRCVESFNPTQNIRDQDSDQFGLSFSRRESMEPGRSGSVFAKTTQSNAGMGGYVAADGSTGPGSSAVKPGTPSWKVLHSKDFECDKRQAPGDGAWSWMNKAAHESMKPSNDNQFSKVLQGL